MSPSSGHRGASLRLLCFALVALAAPAFAALPASVAEAQPTPQQNGASQEGQQGTPPAADQRVNGEVMIILANPAQGAIDAGIAGGADSSSDETSGIPPACSVASVRVKRFCA